jgi:hypothetical protein
MVVSLNATIVGVLSERLVGSGESSIGVASGVSGAARAKKLYWRRALAVVVEIVVEGITVPPPEFSGFSGWTGPLLEVLSVRMLVEAMDVVPEDWLVATEPEERLRLDELVSLSLVVLVVPLLSLPPRSPSSPPSSSSLTDRIQCCSCGVIVGSVVTYSLWISQLPLLALSMWLTRW